MVLLARVCMEFSAMIISLFFLLKIQVVSLFISSINKNGTTNNLLK